MVLLLLLLLVLVLVLLLSRSLSQAANGAAVDGHVEGTRAVLAAADAAGSIRRFVHTGSAEATACYNDDSRCDPFSESDMAWHVSEADDPLTYAKLRAEELVWEHCADEAACSYDAVSLLPTCVFGACMQKAHTEVMLSSAGGGGGGGGAASAAADAAAGCRREAWRRCGHSWRAAHSSTSSSRSVTSATWPLLTRTRLSSARWGASASS